MDMLYYIYIGSNHATIDHLSKVTGGMFMAVSSCNKATKVIDGIRERYNTSILYEQSDPQKDCENITFLHKRFPTRLHHPCHRGAAEGKPQALSAGRCQ